MWEFEIEKVCEEIRKRKAKVVLLQFPNGLKPHAIGVAKEIEKRTNAWALIWANSCFGACDIPKAKADLIVQFGHSEMKLSEKKGRDFRAGSARCRSQFARSRS